MLSKTFSATHRGIDGTVIEIEAARQKALPLIAITGLPGDVIKESRERVRASLLGLGYDVPSARIVVHLSPAHTPKQGSQFDLAIAVGVLLAEGCLRDIKRTRCAFLGELSLDGRVQGIPGALALVEALENDPGIETILVPRANGWEAALADAKKALVVDHLGEVIEYLRGKCELSPPTAASLDVGESSDALDRVLGQRLGKRALQIALAGRHHLLLVGPPGVGKSMLAACAPALLPPLGPSELVDVVKNYGSRRDTTISRARPYRSPHHTISSAAFLGGGSGIVIPGEVTLAHHGVLFLDEFPEYRRDVIEGLREPLQDGAIHLHRIGHSLTLPARFTMIAAMNPCPCGYSLESYGRCSCPPDKVRSYRRRLSGPILDRIDLCVVLGSPRESAAPGLSHVAARESIARASEIQRARGSVNGDHALVLTDRSFALEPKEKAWIDKRLEAGASYRAVGKLIKVGRTLADLEGKERVEQVHLQEAWALRCPDIFGVR